MARRLIGLDIGTNAVTVAEVRAGDPPRLDMFGQVALGRETMREGEVADDAAVTEAVGRLREEVGLKKAAVRLGLASPRVVVRQIEMPLMSREELAQRAPVPGRRADPDPARRRRARLRDPRARRARATAASRACTCCSRRCRKRRCSGSSPPSRPAASRSRPSISCRSRSSGRSPVPLAISRSSARASAGGARRRRGAAGGVALADSGVGAEGIVSFGGGVTAIAVHEVGVPRFVRVLGTGGRELTDAIATRARPPARDRRGAEAPARRRPATTSSSPGPGTRSSARCRCCSTKFAARSTTTATSPARRRCSASSRPAVPRSFPG